MKSSLVAQRLNRDPSPRPGPQIGIPSVDEAPRARSLGDAFSARRNSIAFLRWLFAIAVVIDHTFAIGRFDHGGPFAAWTDRQISLGGLAVAGFFVLSGFLVTRSRDRMTSGTRYLWHRFLRIFPGFWICLAVTAFVLAPIEWHFEASKSGVSALFNLRTGPLQYFRNNFLLTMNQWTIGPLLSNTPRAKMASAGAAWDGSLFTLIYEFRCYIVVAIVCLAARELVRRRTFVVLTGVTALIVAAYEVSPNSSFLHAVPFIAPAAFVRFTLCFMLGALAYYYADFIPISWGSTLLAAAIFLYTLHQGGLYIIGFAAFAYCTLAAAVLLPIHRWDRFGDLSYGVYIYAFPAQMLMAAHNFQRFGLAAFLFTSIAISSVAAFASWHLVEKNALRLKRASWPRPNRGRSRAPVVSRSVPTGCRVTR